MRRRIPLRRYLMPDRIHELLHRNLQEVFGESNVVRRRAAIEDLYTEDCVLYAPPGVLSAPKRSIDLLAISGRPTRTSFTPRAARPRRFTMPGVWRGGRGRAASHPTTQAWMWSSSARERSRRCMCFSTLRLRSRASEFSGYV